MRFKRKNPKSDLRKFYTVFLELGLIAVLIAFIAAVKVDLRSDPVQMDAIDEQDVVEMEDIVQTEQIEKPPPPPRPPVPQEVPNDEVIEEEVVNLDFELDLDDQIEPPPPPEEAEEEEQIFLVVENQPTIVGGYGALQNCIEYPLAARRAGIEGTVTVQFVVNEQGNVEDPNVLRGHDALNQEAIRCVREVEFTPGRQRGNPVKVRMSVPVIFRLTN